MQIICFEDDQVDLLSPIVHARPAYAITCASHRLIDWLRRLVDGGQASSLRGLVRDYLTTLQQLDFEILPPGESDVVSPDDTGEGSGTLLVNARLVPSVRAAEALKQLTKRTLSGAVLDPADGQLLVARITAQDLAELKERPPTVPLLEALQVCGKKQPAIDATEITGVLSAFHWPHDVVSHHMTEMPAAMQWRIEHGDYEQKQDGVFVGSGVKIGNYESIHTSDGPILLEDNVSIGPFCFLEGPLHVGHSTRLLEHSAIKDGVSLGHTVKIGGEVEASVVEPFTNKQHHGFLGHSYLGSWINLGAGTCNSDLKNTYGKINIEYGDKKIATDMQFLGCIMGDYSKSAINTGIFTGKVIGVCSMLYGFVTANVPSYVNYARLFGQTSLLPADVMISTQQRMFARRKVDQRDCDKQLIIDMYERTEHERDGENLGF